MTRENALSIADLAFKHTASSSPFNYSSSGQRDLESEMYNKLTRALFRKIGFTALFPYHDFFDDIFVKFDDRHSNGWCGNSGQGGSVFDYFEELGMLSDDHKMLTSAAFGPISYYWQSYMDEPDRSDAIQRFADESVDEWEYLLSYYYDENYHHEADERSAYIEDLSAVVELIEMVSSYAESGHYPEKSKHEFRGQLSPSEWMEDMIEATKETLGIKSDFPGDLMVCIWQMFFDGEEGFLYFSYNSELADYLQTRVKATDSSFLERKLDALAKQLQDPVGCNGDPTGIEGINWIYTCGASVAFHVYDSFDYINPLYAAQREAFSVLYEEWKKQIKPCELAA